MQTIYDAFPSTFVANWLKTVAKYNQINKDQMDLLKYNTVATL